MELAILFGLILLNGLFAMSEIALVTARKSKLQKLADEGDSSAAAALKLGEDPTKFLSAIQIGITSIGVLNGIVGESVFAPPVAQFLLGLGVPSPISGYLATGIVVVLITYFSIVLGELVPKRIGQISPEPLARIMAKPMLALATITKPFVWLLSTSTKLLLNLMLKPFGINASTEQQVTEEEIHAIIEEGSEAGVIEDQERQMLRNVFRLDDRQMSSLMVPRADIAFLDIALPLADNLKIVSESPHSRFPVCRGGLQDVLGVVSTKLMLSQHLRGETTDLQAHLTQPLYVPETLNGMELLEQFKASSVHMAFVVDEYGELQGMVTQQDLLEAITGEFKPQHAEDAWAVQRDDGSWLLDGNIPIPELKDLLSLKTVPEEEKQHYHTLAGMLLLEMGRVPQTGEHITWEGWRLEVIDMDAKRIDKVLATWVEAVDLA
jgi:putative hemolysin